GVAADLFAHVLRGRLQVVVPGAPADLQRGVLLAQQQLAAERGGGVAGDALGQQGGPAAFGADPVEQRLYRRPGVGAVADRPEHVADAVADEAQQPDRTLAAAVERRDRERLVAAQAGPQHELVVAGAEMPPPGV